MSGEVVVANEVFDGTDRIGQFLRERYRAPDQPGDPLPQGAAEAFSRMGLSSQPGEGLVVG